jgi:hypothetical protein
MLNENHNPDLAGFCFVLQCSVMGRNDVFRRRLMVNDA